MKKEYKTPAMEVMTIQCSHMLCASDVNYGSRHDDPNYDYIGGEGDGGYGYSSNPD